MKSSVSRIVSFLVVFSLLTGCAVKVEHVSKAKFSKRETSSKVTERETYFTDYTDHTTTAAAYDFSSSTDTDKPAYTDKISDYTFLAFMANREINDGNDIQEEIAMRTGVRIKETWNVNQDASEVVGTMIASGDLPDFIDGGNGCKMLAENDCLVAWDDYLKDPAYANLKEMYSDKQWELFRQADGHIYWANVFSSTYGEPTTRTHNDEAFWVQVRVLEDANYPVIETLDDYFALLDNYAKKYPRNDDGTKVIPYTALCEGWRYFCIENAPQYLDGYPNDGSVIVNIDDPSHPKIIDYNTTPTAKMYFKKLNEAYHAGIMDPEFVNMDYDTYIAKLASGAVLGMCDQNWDFAQINNAFIEKGFDKKGYNYVPLGLVAQKGQTKNQWHSYADVPNVSSGIAVTTKCDDPDKAFNFLNACLDQDIHDLRFWGIEGIDYLIDDNGLYYRTEEMRQKWQSNDYQYNHVCTYSYFPQWSGTSHDGKNAMKPGDQESEFFATLSDPIRRAFDAYGYTSYGDFLRSEHIKEHGIWYPMYTYSNQMDTTTNYGLAWAKMGDCKHEWLPKLVLSGNFEAEWANYMNAYAECRPQDFLDEMQRELDRRNRLG